VSESYEGGADAMRRLRRVGLALVAAVAFSSSAYAFNPLSFLTSLNPFKSSQKTQAAASSSSRRPEVVAGKGYDARSSNPNLMGTSSPKSYTPTKTRFWK
jgi:hypothetical protein